MKEAVPELTSLVIPLENDHNSSPRKKKKTSPSAKIGAGIANFARRAGNNITNNLKLRKEANAKKFKVSVNICVNISVGS